MRSTAVSYDKAGWVAVVAVVIAADYLGDKTMSDLFLDCYHHPVGKPVIIGVWVFLTAHLFAIIPEQYDPLRLAFNRIKHGRVSVPG